MIAISLEQACARLAHLRARRPWWRRWARRRAAVAMLLREGEAGLEVLMIERAQRKGDRWSGQMAFPGGMMSAADRHSLAAATRETLEEIGLDMGPTMNPIARLSDVSAPLHRGFGLMLITPYVFALDNVPTLALNDEVAHALWVPLQLFTDPRNRGVIHWRRLPLPCYDWQGRRIWGLSLQMLEELLAQLRIDASDERKIR